MKTNQLLNESGLISRLDSRILELDIKGIADNSSDVAKGFVFVAIKGFEIDGHGFIDQAIEKGAALVIGEQGITRLGVPYLQVENSRKALGILARNFYAVHLTRK